MRDLSADSAAQKGEKQSSKEAAAAGTKRGGITAGTLAASSPEKQDDPRWISYAACAIGSGMTGRKRSPRKAKPASKFAGTPRRLSSDRRIILLDQEPLRRKAASECNKAMARLEKAKAEWNRFESEDRNGFQRWMASTFGALLSQIRESEQELQEKESLVSAVELEAIFGGGGYRAAYKRVTEERDRPPAPDEEYTPPPSQNGEKARHDEFDDDSDEFDDVDEFEQMMMFEDFVRTVLGQDPSFMPDDLYETAFAEFRAQVFGQRKKNQPDREFPESSFNPLKTEESRIKELYRVLVRRLHPDTRADSDAQVSALWHEVQEAYSQGNIERLEMLLALTDMQSGATGEHTSLSQMRSVLAELRRALAALQRNLAAAKKDPAWGFSTRKNYGPLEKLVGKELQKHYASLRVRLKDLNRLIESWKSAPRRKKKPTKKAAKKPATKATKKATAARMEQTDLPF